MDVAGLDVGKVIVFDMASLEALTVGGF